MTTKKHTPTAEADAALAETLGIEQPETQPQGTTIADNFVQMNALIVSERTRTRLSEATLVKTLELTMNYHVWSTQREEARAQQAAQQSFDPAMYMPQADEEITEAEDDNTVRVNFTPETKKED